MMIEDQGASLQTHEEETRNMLPKHSRGKLDGLVPGTSFVAYSTSGQEREIGIGLYRTNLEDTKQVEAHVYGVVTDSRLRVRWKPLYRDEYGEPAFADKQGTGDLVLEKIEYKIIIRAAGQMNDGTLRHSDARALDQQR